jgi:hypothetical protein
MALVAAGLLVLSLSWGAVVLTARYGPTPLGAHWIEVFVLGGGAYALGTVPAALTLAIYRRVQPALNVWCVAALVVMLFMTVGAVQTAREELERCQETCQPRLGPRQ